VTHLTEPLGGLLYTSSDKGARHLGSLKRG
jgi:hypothetical protein